MGSAKSISWSFTRSRSLNCGCLRRHFYAYYSSGEEFGSRAWKLSKLVSPETLVGQVVDASVRSDLRVWRNAHKEKEGFVEEGVNALHKALLNSKVQADSIREGKAIGERAQPLHEDYYGNGLDQRAVDALEDKVIKSLDGWRNSGVRERILKFPIQHWHEDSPQESFHADAWYLNDLKIWSSLDWYALGSKWIFVVDFKASYGSDRTAADTAFQLASYAMWAQSIGYKLDQVFVQPAYLPTKPRWEPRTVSTSEVESARGAIEYDHQVERNLITFQESPQKAMTITAQIENFPPSPEARRCSQCAYLELCSNGIRS